MNKRADIALLVDMSAETLKFVIAVKGGVQSNGLSEAIQRPVEDFGKANQMRKAVLWALKTLKVPKGPIDIIMSIPGPVAGEVIEPPEPSEPAKWQFTRADLAKEIGDAGWTVERIEAVNDMLACGVALPALVQAGRSFALNPDGVSKPGFPMLVACARPNLGACGLAPVPYRTGLAEDEPPVWIPVLSEPGGMSLSVAKYSLTGERLREPLAMLQDSLPKSAEGLWTAHDFLGPTALRDGFRLLEPDTEIPTPSLAEIASGVTPAAATLAEAWSFMFGLWVRSLTLAFGARGGVNILGCVPAAIFGEANGRAVNRTAFLDAFTMAGLPNRYLADIPVNLVDHEEPFLTGLGRLAENDD